MPNQLCDLKNIVEVPVLESKADPQFFYIYSVFFRDYLSFTRVDEIIKADPESHLMIIMGSGHSLRRFPFSLTEERKKTAEFYGIETDKYCHTLGAFLETSFDPVFVVSRISQRNSERSLEKYTRGAGKLAITEDEDVNLDEYYADYVYTMPGEGQVYREEVPLLVIPSSTNLSVLEENHFQVDFREPYPTIAKRLVYFFTGIAPEIKPTPMGIGADFINPEDNQKMDFQEYKEMVLKW